MPLSAARLIRYERLRTPPAHGDVLIEPEPGDLPGLLRDASASDYDRTPLLDVTLGSSRAALRNELGLAAPIIVVGHQAEFFHAGVFAKTIAAHALAGASGGSAVFLTVDADLPKTRTLAMPQATPSGLRQVDVEIPGCEPQVPYEHQPALTRDRWLQFFAGLGAMYGLRDASLLGPFARAWLDSKDAQVDYCDALARGRAVTEADLGLTNIRELRLSKLCTTTAFRTFLAHLIVHARETATHYNGAQDAFRQRHGVGTVGRPVPKLLVNDDTVELPFWVIHPDNSRRRLFVRADGDEIELSTDSRVVGRMARETLSEASTHQQQWPLEDDGFQLRPRALALSAFARLLLADLFIHGIGGAKYDELMEEFISNLFGVDPMPACCVSATLHLPLPSQGVTEEDLRAAERRSRDVRYNPERHIEKIPEDLRKHKRMLVRRSRELRANTPGDHATRREIFREIRHVNEQMLAQDPWRVSHYDQQIDTLRRQLELDRIATDRTYFYALHPRNSLTQLVDHIRGVLRSR